jgi:predicted RNase H-like nuclease (RuvC/YqgF family)
MQDHEHKLIHAINHLNQRIEHMTIVWERLEAKVSALKTIEESVVALIKTFTDAMKDAVQNAKDLADAQVKIDALEADFTAQAKTLGDAVAAGQPGVPVPPVPTDPTTGAPVDPNAPVNDPSVDPSTLRSRRR